MILIYIKVIQFLCIAKQLIHCISSIDILVEDSFNLFKAQNPDIVIDPDGKSEPTEKNYWEIELLSLESVYINATDDGIVNTQVRDAKELKYLKKYKGNTPSEFIKCLNLD